jgi:hypothetical protein
MGLKRDKYGFFSHDFQLFEWEESAGYDPRATAFLPTDLDPEDIDGAYEIQLLNICEDSDRRQRICLSNFDLLDAVAFIRKRLRSQYLIVANAKHMEYLRDDK